MNQASILPEGGTGAKRQLWPIFICYRRVDGYATARRLHELLDKWQITGPDGKPVQLDVYLDTNMPGVGDWRELHRPYLEKARAILIVCTPGAKLNEGAADWVHVEIDWWLRHRDVAPILVDPLMEGERYVPSQIGRRWPEIQRITLVEAEWAALSGAGLEEKAQALRTQVLGAILPSGAEIYAQELDQERRRVRQLRGALAVAGGLLLGITALAGYAMERRRAAIENERVAKASELDARAAGLFAQARLVASQREGEAQRRDDLSARILAAGGRPKAEMDLRQGNLENELEQVRSGIRTLRAEETRLLAQGRDVLAKADAAWAQLKGTAGTARSRPDPPHVFSVEILNAGDGESLLIHYGTPDDIKLVMINGGPRDRATYERYIQSRLRQLALNRFDGAPLPIELFVVSDQDIQKTGGLFLLLSDLAAAGTDRFVEIRGLWANLFARADGSPSFRGELRSLVDQLQLPLNKPFEHAVVRPEKGRVGVTLPGGLELIVLGPKQKQVQDLYEMAAKAPGEHLPAETFGGLKVAADPLARPETSRPTKDGCIPSDNARDAAGGAYVDRSVPNLASSVVLFRYEGKTFLFTGDSRGDYILEGLEASGLMQPDGDASIDLLSIPHQGSDRNITVDFFRRLRASGYLFSGDGTFGNPEVTTVASLIHARGCDAYRMYFVNRDGAASDDEYGKKLDKFFEAERRYHPNYTRIFRSEERGSIVVNLLEPLRN